MAAVFTVGLTGGLASGKSTVARQLVGFGVHVCDADAIVHELYRPGQPGADRVAQLFGAQMLDDRGGVDRDRLAAMVLEAPDALLRLQAAIHPLVDQRLTAWIEALAGLGGGVVAAVEAALLVESGSHQQYDLLMVVWCERNQQLQRAIARGVPRDRAERLLAAQLDLDAKRDLADVVVDNSGSRANLVDRVAAAWVTIQQRAWGVAGP